MAIRTILPVNLPVKSRTRTRKVTRQTPSFRIQHLVFSLSVIANIDGPIVPATTTRSYRLRRTMHGRAICLRAPERRASQAFCGAMPEQSLTKSERRTHLPRPGTPLPFSAKARRKVGQASPLPSPTEEAPAFEPVGPPDFPVRWTRRQACHPRFGARRFRSERKALLCQRTKAPGP